MSGKKKLEMIEDEQIEFVAAREYVTIKTDKGDIVVPALTHPKSQGLAVTMSGFGVFEVTHIRTGLKLTGRHERMGTALLLMSKFVKIAQANDFTWDDLSQEEAKQTMNDLSGKEVPFEGYEITSNGKTKRGSIGDWINGLSMYSFDSVIGEFPWEESNPLDEALEILAQV